MFSKVQTIVSIPHDSGRIITKDLIGYNDAIRAALLEKHLPALTQALGWDTCEITAVKNPGSGAVTLKATFLDAFGVSSDPMSKSETNKILAKLDSFFSEVHSVVQRLFGSPHSPFLTPP